ncbi:hypothetical protein [Paraburkholderia aromaticivorans]|uniref:Uncharacterized protein n=1 Tax=Paraburkholderia aromaticivorans TaxID=2026199 RepID=A0A248VI83_9BURK|nr:hypothetical protein [Paraburkholderia aromaticivorans]ASV98736.1 hypothetical protein CJU94_11510 [Paraburkholderia aromaticivorans]
MKSRLIPKVRAIGQWLPLRSSRCSIPPLSHAGLVLGGVVCALTLSGCYYPYGYYPAGYYPYYGTVPASATQQAVPLNQDGSYAAPQQQQAQVPADQQASPPTYAVAAPPVYVAPAYPVYYPPPVYPAYYGYPGWYGPSVSIGFGFGGYWGGHGGGHGHGHGH